MGPHWTYVPQLPLESLSIPIQSLRPNSCDIKAFDNTIRQGQGETRHTPHHGGKNVQCTFPSARHPIIIYYVTRVGSRSIKPELYLLSLHQRLNSLLGDEVSDFDQQIRDVLTIAGQRVLLVSESLDTKDLHILPIWDGLHQRRSRRTEKEIQDPSPKV